MIRERDRDPTLGWIIVRVTTSARAMAERLGESKIDKGRKVYVGAGDRGKLKDPLLPEVHLLRY
jgi:hypothetical protein